MGPLHTGNSHFTHPGQCKLQHYDRSTGFYPHLATLPLYFEHRKTCEDGLITTYYKLLLLKKKNIWSSTNPGIQPPSGVASDSCRDLSVLLSFNSSWMSDGVLCLVCARMKCLGSSTDLLNPQCAYSTRSSITFLQRSPRTILSSKSIFLSGLSGLLSYWVSGYEMQQWGCQKDTSEPVLPVQDPGLICNTNKTSCCWHCQAGAALWAPLLWREGLLRAPAVHSSHWQHLPGSHLQTTEPLPLPDRSLHPSTGELVFLVWAGNATHPFVSNLVWGVCCQM